MLLSKERHSNTFMEMESDKEIFLQAFDSHSDAIFRFCLFKTSNKELAEDLTQEVFMRYWQALRVGKEMSNTKSFLYTIARNAIIDWYRKKKSTSLDTLQESGFEPADSARTENVQKSAEYSEILSAIDGMDESDQEVLILRFVEGLDPKDIAEILNETANVISVRINRAQERVRKQLRL